MWQPQWAATIWKIAGSGVSIKLLSVMQLLSATGFCIGRAVMALPLFFIHGKLTQKDTHVSLLNYSFRLS